MADTEDGGRPAQPDGVADPPASGASGGSAGARGALAGAGLLALASAVTLGLTAATSVLLARLLAPAEYGVWSIVVLYGGYAGALHLGLPDGAVVRWAGDRPADRAREIGEAFAFFVGQQLVAGALCLGLILVLPADPSLGRAVWTALLGYALLLNLFVFGQLALQAFARFAPLAAATAAAPAALLAGVGAAAALGRLGLRTVLAAMLASVAVAAAVALRPLVGWADWRAVTARGAWATGRRLTGSGALYLAGNFVLVLVFGLDRLVASRAVAPAAFAPYALAGLVIGTLYVGLSAVTSVLLPHLARIDHAGRVAAYARLRAGALALWGVALTGYFPAAVAIDQLFPRYRDAVPPLRVLLVAVGAGAVVRSAHYNYYRLAGRNRAYVGSGLASAAAVAPALWWGAHSGAPLLWYAWCAVAASAVWAALNESLLAAFAAAPPRELARAWLGWFAFAAAFAAAGALPLPLLVAGAIYLVAALGIATAVAPQVLRLLAARLGRGRRRGDGGAATGAATGSAGAGDQAGDQTGNQAAGRG